jgi:3(or 17)beta-hydroxysteroid dehydrogenase
VAAGAGSANEVRAEVIAMHPIGRIGLPTEIGSAVAFLACDDSAFMTGTEIIVDGGITAR